MLASNNKNLEQKSNKKAFTGLAPVVAGTLLASARTS